MKKTAVLAATLGLFICGICWANGMVTIEGTIQHDSIQPEAYAIVTDNGKIYEVWSSALDLATEEFAACIKKGSGKVSITTEADNLKKTGILVMSKSAQCLNRD